VRRVATGRGDAGLKVADGGGALLQVTVLDPYFDRPEVKEER
jgi:hypothetical protein